MDPLLHQMNIELAGDATDDLLNSSTAFKLGDPTLSMPAYSAPQISYAPTPAAPSPATQAASFASALAPAATAAYSAAKNKGKAPLAAAAPKPVPGFFMSPAFGGMNWATVIGGGAAVSLIGVATIMLVRNAASSGGRRSSRRGR